MLNELPPATPAELDEIEGRIDRWLDAARRDNPLLAAVDRGGPGERRWFVRLVGDDKDFTTVWLRLGQRALHFETYVMPAPEENEGAFYAHLLRRNRALHGMWFAIGEEEAIFLMGQLLLRDVDEPNLDRVLGSVWTYVERVFRPALRLGFASRFAG